ncbi:hypothetical protein VPH35_058823 [Triticum aestivum]
MDVLLLEKALLGLFAAAVLAIAVAKLTGKRFRLPPGPSGAPIVGNWLQVGDDLNHRNLMGLAKRFGEVFLLRMGVRNLVVVSSPELAKEDLRADPAAATAGVVVRRRLQLMMYNDMFRIMFDRRFESTADPLFNQLKALNAERSILSQSFDYNYGDFIPVLRPFLRRYLNRCTNLKTKRMKVFEDQFVQPRKEALEKTGEIRCAMDHILEAERKGEINHDNVLYIVENINVAAIETTLWSIEWGIAELVNHPEIQQKLREEIVAVLGAGAAVTEPDLERLPYLQSVVKETLRLRMAIPLLVPHMNLSDAKLAGYDIPAESKILVNAWFLANDPKRWVRADEFRPERFLEEEKAVEAHGNDFRFVPFGVGRRSCPGIILALPIIGITLGRLVQNFQLLPPPGQDKIDTTEKPGQFSNQILKHATIVCKPLEA